MIIDNLSVQCCTMGELNIYHVSDPIHITLEEWGFALRLNNDTYVEINYCPFCGKKLEIQIMLDN